MSLPNADPFFLPGGATGCLLIHGFSGSPTEMRGLGDYLNAQGHTVQGVCLAGHGYSPEALRATRWHDWFDSVITAFHQLQQQCTNIVVIGFSFGGSLAMLLNTRYSFERMVLLATPIRLQGDWRLHLLPLARYIMPWYYPLEQADFADSRLREFLREKNSDLDLDDPAVQQHLRRSIKIPVSAVDELRRGLQHTRAALAQVRVPTLVMHGCCDETIDPANAQVIMDNIGSTQKRLVWWQQTGHQMLVVGPERAAIYERTATFVTHGLC